MPGRPHSKRQATTIVAAAVAVAAGIFLWSSAGAQSVEWVTVTSQGAFTIEVPVDWTPVLQTYETRGAAGPIAVAQAKDGTTLLLGDPYKRAYYEPNGGTAFEGTPEGGFFNGVMIQHYRTGGQYAAEVGSRTVMPGHCGNAQISEPSPPRQLPQQSQMLDFAYQQGGVQATIAAGDATFACTTDKGPLAGYVFAATLRGQNDQTNMLTMQIEKLGVWNVPIFVGFVAHPAKAGLASELLEHFAASLTFDHNWVAAHQAEIRDISIIQAQANAAVSTAISNGFWYRRALMDKTFAQGSQARRGVTVYFDPVLQENHELPTGGYKWINSGGTIVSTVTPDPPAAGFRQLQRPLMLPGTSR